MAAEWRATIAADTAAQAAQPPQPPLSEAYLAGGSASRAQGGPLAGLFGDAE